DRAPAGPRQPGGALLAAPRLREGGTGRGGRARARGVRQARQGAADGPLGPAVGRGRAGGGGAAAEELIRPSGEPTRRANAQSSANEHSLRRLSGTVPSAASRELKKPHIR